MANQKRYNIQELATSGWEVINEVNTTNLTKEDCKVRLEELMREGYNPNSLRAVPA